MIAQELPECFRVLRAYWPELDWNADRLAVFADVLIELDLEHALAAIRSMGRGERFPSVKALVDAAGDLRPRTRSAGHFASGSGFISDFVPQAGELPSGEQRNRVVVHLEEMRRLLRPSRRRDDQEASNQ